MCFVCTGLDHIVLVVNLETQVKEHKLAICSKKGEINESFLQGGPLQPAPRGVGYTRHADAVEHDKSLNFLFISSFLGLLYGLFT